MASGIRDKVAILGMGCSRFGERWDAGADELMLEAFNEALLDAGIGLAQIEAASFGVCLEENNVGKTAGPLAGALRLPRIAATRVENACATGTEALRGAAYAVASGAYDIVLALGVEKLKDTGYGGLPVRTRGVANDLGLPNATAPGAFAQLASAYAAKHGVAMADLKRAMAHISVKSHANALHNPKAHLRIKITEEDVLKAMTIAAPLGLYDCCGVSDGAACAIVTTPEIARALKPGAELVTIKALELSVSNGVEQSFSGHGAWDGAHIATAREAGARACASAGITDPRRQLQMAEVHDCFSITEAVLMEDLGLQRARPRDPRRARRRLRPRRRAAGAARRRPEMLRPSDRRVGPAHGLRDLPADPRPRRRAPAEKRRPRVDPQPRRPPAPERVRRGHRRPSRRLSVWRDMANSLTAARPSMRLECKS